MKLCDSHFIHGITFELFLWCDIAGMNANITTERGVWWVILVVANASCQILFHCPVIRGKVEINPQKPQVLVGRLPSYTSRSRYFKTPPTNVLLTDTDRE